MRRTDLPHVTLDGRHAGELLAHPCGCGHLMCTLGDHIWQSTTDMTPGPKAKTFEPPTANGHIPHDNEPAPDPTNTIDIRFTQAIQTYWNAARELIRLIDALRPDRWTPLPEPATDDQWCSHHLETIGTCEPRYRGDLCRGCYDLGTTYGMTPDRELMQTRHVKGYYPDADVKAWLARRPKTTKTKKRKKAS